MHIRTLFVPSIYHMIASICSRPVTTKHASCGRWKNPQIRWLTYAQSKYPNRRWSTAQSSHLLLIINFNKKIIFSKNYTLKKEVVAGCFFYVDKFVLIGTENKFLLCKYYVDSKKHDVQRYILQTKLYSCRMELLIVQTFKRYLNGTYCKLVKQIELTFAQSITAISTINSFYSCNKTRKYFS